ncbi:MAG: hypothetical protein ACYDDA_12845 [Acidiferrobacteraceae bacterium]
MHCECIGLFWVEVKAFHLPRARRGELNDVLKIDTFSTDELRAYVSNNPPDTVARRR